ncbi:MAG: hypothetical protein K2K46_08895, partial [Lachnospiraceae bacterium]|nr:hypothetical protein [Lachnospiraceae bacterium]
MGSRTEYLTLLKKYLVRIAGFIGGLIIFICIVNVLNYMYVNNKEINGGRLLFHYFYEDKGKIDN